MAFPSRILLVEDEALLAANLKAFLDRHSADVRVASDAPSALEILKSFAPELLVLDYALPGIDGLRTYEAIVSGSARRPPCVMISGHATELIVDRVRRQGIAQLLCKPFSFAQLKQAIDLATGEPTLDLPLINRRVQARRSKRIGTCPTANRRRQPTRRSAAFGSAV